ncbi:hypothetical protein WJX73_010277 [Symbiochloris irregularis]|uniref:Zinc finger PHD-type domain-containing protein n=1 Tax=Symbiochloris irregularis TaxID=706552 RepID=A0AAW1NRQ0_9CHLO
MAASLPEPTIQEGTAEEEFPQECDSSEPVCQTCGDHGGASAFVECENVQHGCIGGQHLYCFNPPRKGDQLPIGKFYCKYCRDRGFQHSLFIIERFEQPAKRARLDNGDARAGHRASDPGQASGKGSAQPPLRRSAGSGSLEFQPSTAAAQSNGLARSDQSAGAQAETVIRVRALGVTERPEAGRAAKRLPLSLTCTPAPMLDLLGIGDDEAYDSSVLLMTAEAGEGRQEDVMQFSTLCRSLASKRQVLQVKMQDMAVWLALMPNVTQGGSHTMWVAFVAVEEPSQPAHGRPSKPIVRQAGRKAVRRRIHWCDKRKGLDRASPALTFPHGPVYHSDEAAQDPLGDMQDEAADVELREPVGQEPLQPRPLEGLKYSAIGYPRNEWWHNMIKVLAQLGAQHYQRPCAGVGLKCIVLEPKMCQADLPQLSAHQGRQGYQMDDIVEFLRDVHGETRFFRGHQVLEFLHKQQRLPRPDEVPEVQEIMRCGVIILTQPTAFAEAVHSGFMKQILQLLKEGRDATSEECAWCCKMTKGDFGQLSALDKQAHTVFVQNFGNLTKILQPQEESQSTQPVPPKQVRDATKLANVSIGATRHVILMTSDPALLDQMASQGLAHALSAQATVQFLQAVVDQIKNAEGDKMQVG